MSAVAGVGVDERRARVVVMAEPDDPVTGGLLRRVGAIETLGLLDTKTSVPGVGWVDGQVCGVTALPHQTNWKALARSYAWLRRAESPR